MPDRFFATCVLALSWLSAAHRPHSPDSLQQSSADDDMAHSPQPPAKKRPLIADKHIASMRPELSNLPPPGRPAEPAFGGIGSFRPDNDSRGLRRIRYVCLDQSVDLGALDQPIPANDNAPAGLN
jgi:hypothetical protein